MTHDIFVEKYTEIVRRAIKCSKKARREGLLALEDELDWEKADDRDIFECGLRLVIDGTDKELVDKILSNLLKQEKDEQMHILKTIQKEAVLMIQDGYNPRIIYLVLNSYSDITLKADREIQKMFED